MCLCLCVGQQRMYRSICLFCGGGAADSCVLKEPRIRWRREWTNTFAATRGDKLAMRPFARLLWTLVLAGLDLLRGMTRRFNGYCFQLSLDLAILLFRVSSLVVTKGRFTVSTLGLLHSSLNVTQKMADSTMLSDIAHRAVSLR